MKRATILYLLDDKEKVLMAKKQRVLGIGCWFGYGGKIEPGETPEQCVCREMAEESGGVRVREEDVERVALIDYYVGERKFSNLRWRALFYVAKRWDGIPVSTEEMDNPNWFPINDLPFHEMKAGDELVIPRILKGEKIAGFICFSEDENEVIAYRISTCNSSQLVI